MITRIENVNVITMDADFRQYENSSVTIKDDIIIGIDANISADKVIDGKGGILMPGMVNTHAHLAMIPFRSLGDDCPDRLRRFLFPLESAAMTEKLIYLATKYACAELLLGGVTQVFDMYFFAGTVARALAEMGVRGTVAETILDFAHCNSGRPYGGLDYSEKFIPEWKDKNPLITPAIAPHATNTNSAEALLQAKKIAEKYDVQISMHVSEMDYEMDYFRREYNMTPVEYLDSIGLLSPDLLAVHCIHATESDIRLMAEKGVKVSHCIGSNTKAGKGIMPLKEMLAAGITVGLGSDGASSGNTLDIISQLSQVCKAHKTKNHDRSLFSAGEAVKLATVEGAKALGTDSMTGSIETGKKADLVLIETRSVNMFPVHDVYSAVVYSANPSNVHSVWVNGMQRVDNKQLVGVDIEKLRKELDSAMTEFRKFAKIQTEKEL